MKIRKCLIFLVALVFFVACDSTESAEDVLNETPVAVEINEPVGNEPDYTPDADLQRFFDEEISEQQVLIKGEVIKNLPNDNDGSRHQKFLVRLESGQTLLIAHNIDLADRIANLHEGDEVIIYGQYEWNDKGGVIHWTHHDPDGYHVGGWIEHKNHRYE